MNRPEHGERVSRQHAAGVAAQGQQSRGGYFAAPLSSASSGRLVFSSGVSRVCVRAAPEMQGLYRASFASPVPTVLAHGGTVTIRYPRPSILGWLSYRQERPAEVALSVRLPWDIEVRGGVSRLTADLRGLQLHKLNLSGGASRVEAMLPRPPGTVAVRLLGGASNIVIHRPVGIAARVRVSGGVTNLTFDERHFGAVGGEIDLRSPGYDDASDRYDIAVTGGANGLLIDDAGPGNSIP